jgi:uncharacterized membrane protein YgcG
MFRDRVVSMEQTLEGGEKYLELLKALCLEALPDFAYREHVLDHERDLFVIVLDAADGRRKSVSWTRMMLFDAERLPAIVSEPSAALRVKIVEFLRERASRPEIVVTFRHLEEGWTDTPEPRPSRRRRRRGRGAAPGRPPERGSPPGRPQEKSGAGRPGGPRPAPPQRSPQRPPQPARPPASATGAGPGPAAPGRPGEGQAPGSRRRFRRRRRGRGGGSGGGGGGGAGGGGAPAPPRAQ